MTEQKNELVPVGPTGLTKQEEEAFTKDDGLGYITLMHGISKAVTKNSPDGIRGGDYLLNGHVRIPAGNAGPGFRCAVILGENGPMGRPRAVQFENDDVEADSYDPRSDIWARIAADAAKWRKGAKAGVEIMLWLPDHDALAILFCANKERQISAPILFTCARERRLAQVTSTTRGKNDTFVFDVRPIATSEVIPMPAKDRLDRCIATFLAYKDEKPAPPKAPGGRTR